MRDKLHHLETQLERLVEGTLARLLGNELSPGLVAGQVARAMADVAKQDAEGREFAPDQYALTLHPRDAETLLSLAPDIQQQLADGLREAARQNGFLLAEPPHIAIAADPTLGRWQVRVVAWHSGSPLEFTHPMMRPIESVPSELPSGAFLIVNGKRHFPLDRPVINIGRRLDNQLILDNPHVSRTHAQMRLRNGRYVIFDLGSTTGTSVNGHEINQHTLRAGDVISIGGVRLVYGEDPGGPPDTTESYTPPFPPRPAGDLRTRGDIRRDD